MKNLRNQYLKKAIMLLRYLRWQCTMYRNFLYMSPVHDFQFFYVLMMLKLHQITFLTVPAQLIS